MHHKVFKSQHNFSFLEQLLAFFQNWKIFAKMLSSKSEQFLCSSAIDSCDSTRSSFSGVTSDIVDLPWDVR